MSAHVQPHAPNGLGRTGPRRTRPLGGDMHRVRGPIAEGDLLLSTVDEWIVLVVALLFDQIPALAALASNINQRGFGPHDPG